MADNGLHSSTEFWGAVALAAGAVGVLAVSVLYRLSPPEVALPAPHPFMPQALEGAIRGAPLLRAASIVGIIADTLLAVGALAALVVRRSALERLGWAALAISGIVFCLVDALVGQILPEIAAVPGGDAAFLAMKRLFDVLFIVGAFALGIGFLGVFQTAFNQGSRVLRSLGLAVGIVALVGVLAHLGGANAGQPIGFSLLGGAAVLAIFSTRLALGARSRMAERLPLITVSG